MPKILSPVTSLWCWPRVCVAAVVLIRLLSVTSAAEPARVAPALTEGPAAWVENEFPFFSSVLDARKAGEDMPADNLTPRGIILNIGGGYWACFDPDLLRVSAVWQGVGVSPDALAPKSYFIATKKTQLGQNNLPKPRGQVWLANGIYPGWQMGEHFSMQDPREPAPSVEEVGRGPIDPALGRFSAVRLAASGVVLEYLVGQVRIRETWSVLAASASSPRIVRQFEVGPSSDAMTLVLGVKTAGVSIELHSVEGTPESDIIALGQEGETWTARVPARAAVTTFAVVLNRGDVPSGTFKLSPFPETAAAARWAQEITTSVKLSSLHKAYVVDRVGLPDENPWRRKVRPCDIQFLSDGTAVMVTFDGDVWIARGLQVTAGPVRWRRFTSGLHEPMSVAIRDDEIFVFDRNGIWRLRDTDGNGEADAHELFSNAFAQTADMREFPCTIRLAPQGEFIIAKGGQEDKTLGKHNGSVLRISADGKMATVIGHGFRQPNIGVNIRTGLVTSSDQQGQYIPSTPLHIVRDNQFYGFLPAFLPREQYSEPIADPLTWAPHSANASAISQVWLFNARLGPLNDGFVQIAFNKPELLRILLNERGSRPQASMVSLVHDFNFPLLNGSVNPADGQLYIAGFQVIGWGNVLDTLAGLGRVRYTGAPVTVPREIVPMDQGVLLRFDVALDPVKARDPNSYSLQTWSYRRAFSYGSAQYKEDGTAGEDSLTASSAYVSLDGRSVFVAVPGLKPVMQLRMGWTLATRDGEDFSDSASTTPYELVKFSPGAEGFGDLTVDLTPRTAAKVAEVPVSIAEGKRLSQLFACVACHATEVGALAKSGPSWRGLFGSQHPVFIAGKRATVLADEKYLRESILEPTTKLAIGFEKGEYAMPSFAGVLHEPQIESLILYIKTLR